MISDWFHHTYAGSPLFVQDGDALLIINDGAADRGSWIGRFRAPFAPGDRFVVRGSRTGGTVAVVFRLACGGRVTLPVAAPGREVTVPEQAQEIRLDGRLWRGRGTARFAGLDLTAVPSPRLPIPAPHMIQKHRVTRRPGRPLPPSAFAGPPR